MAVSFRDASRPRPLRSPADDGEAGFGSGAGGPVDPGRRLVLLGLGALGLAACTGRGRHREPRPHHGRNRGIHHDRGAGTGDPGAAPPTTDPTTSTTEAPDDATVSKRPSRDEIISRHGHRVPSRWGLEGLPGLIERTSGPGIVLTLDLCGGRDGSGLDEPIVDLLVVEEVPTVFFVNRRWIDANPSGFDRLLRHDDLFEIANHGTSHRPLSVEGRSAYGIAGTADVGEVHDEVVGNHERIRELTGRAPRWFRSGTAHYDDVALDIVADLGERAVGFDVNADGGATFGAGQVAAAIADAGDGSILIGHANRPASGTAEGLRTAIPAMRARGLDFVPLEPSIVAIEPVG